MKHPTEHTVQTYEEPLDSDALVLDPGRTFHIHTFGCQLNENDSEKMAGILMQLGMTPTDDMESADFILLNTCSVRKNADDRLFGNLGRLKTIKRERPDLLIAVCGCMMKQTQHVEKIRKSYPYVDLVFGPADIHRLPQLLLRRLGGGAKRVYDVGEEDTLTEGLPIQRGRKYRALVSIMYGCNNFCSYCIVPYTRGRERSRSPESIRKELAGLAAAGYREVLLLGQNVNSYGNDMLPDNDAARPTFADILEMAASFPVFERIRFMTSHPKDIDRHLLDVMAAHPNIEQHLHLPLQSGSDKVLKEMNRHYTRDQYVSIAQAARDKMPDLAISTDLIVGFPGETEEDFLETLDVMETVRFDSAFMFLYSPREGTPAASRTDVVDDAVAHERFDRLVTVQDRLSLNANLPLEGTVQQVLIEGKSSRPGVYAGRTTHNRLVNFTLPEGTLEQLPDAWRKTNLENLLAPVRIHAAHAYYLEGRLEGDLR